MEKRIAKVMFSAVGGTAAAGSKTGKLTIPSSWLAKMGITEDNRNVELLFTGDEIRIRMRETYDTFLQSKTAVGHELYQLNYYNDRELCTVILADFTDRSLYVENKTNNLVKTAFGKKQLPLWNDFVSFLEERCIPRGRVGLREYLETIGLDEYAPWEIVKKTQGRMAEDQQWIEIEVL